MKLNLKQTQAIDFLESKAVNEVVFGGGAGGGKSFIGVYWQLKNRYKYPGTRGLIGRAKLKTLKETTLKSFFEVCKILNIKADIHYKYNQQSNIIQFNNGSEILLKDLFFYPSDPEFDELGSLEITDAFIDEANQITQKAKQIVRSRIRYRLEEYDLTPKILYTCNPSKNWVYKEFYQPSKNGTLTPDKKFIQALVTDNPNIDKSYIENLKRLDETSRQRLFYGNWEYDDDANKLINYDSIVSCFSNTFVNDGIKYISSDIARFGRDATIIGVWSGFRLVDIVKIDKATLTDTAQMIDSIAIQYRIPRSNIAIDEDGVGGGVVDILRGCKGIVSNSKPIDEMGVRQNYSNLKSQLYFKLAERINRNEYYFCNKFSDQITEELEQVKQKNLDADGKKAIIPKDEVKRLIGRSPDFSDMIMMREFFEISQGRIKAFG
jgi:phage terminase large subunit